MKTHRLEVRQAVMEAAWQLACQEGLLSVTMSRVAADAGIGRATLYKYFPDVEAILTAWHQQHVHSHLAHLIAVRDQTDGVENRLRAVLAGYAHMCRHRAGRGTQELINLLHEGTAADRAQDDLHHLVRAVLEDAANSGFVRTDISSDQLTTYCLHALTAANALPTTASPDGLIDVVLTGLRTPRHA